MNAKISLIVIFCAFLAFAILVAGFVLSGGDNAGSPGTPTAAPGASSTPVPGDQGTWPVVTTPTPTPGNGGTSATPTPVPGTNQTIATPTPTPTPVPVWSATADDWGSDKDTYSRGATATGWVYVTNTGNVPITQIDFAIVIKRTIFFVPVEKYFPYNSTGLSIQPGVKQQVAFSIEIPSEYQGISTAGNYQLTATAFLAGKSIGSFSKNIKVV